MRRFLLPTVLAAGVLVPTFLTSSARADRQRNPADVVRAQLTKLHVRLVRDALSAPEIDIARKAAAEAYANLYQIRENLLIVVRQKPEYVDLKLAVWHQQRLIEGMHDEIPVRIQKIMTNAKSTLALRSQISRMESDALEASDDYLAARDELSAKTAEYNRARRDAMDRVRLAPEFISMRQQWAATSQSVSRTIRAKPVVYP